MIHPSWLNASHINPYPQGNYSIESRDSYLQSRLFKGLTGKECLFLCDFTQSVFFFILQKKTSQLKHGIAGKPVAIIFYGTTHVCEAFIILLRYIDYWVIKQKVCQLMFLAKSLTEELVTALSTEHSIAPHMIIEIGPQSRM